MKTQYETKAQLPGWSGIMHFARSRRAKWIAAAATPLAAAPLWLCVRNQLQLSLPLHTFAGLVLILVAVAVTLTDIRAYCIPNWITYSALLWGLAINVAACTTWGASFAAPLGAVGIVPSLLGATVLLIIMLIIFSHTGGGAGDVKLAAAVGALLGLGRGVDAVTYAMVLAGLGTAVIAMVRYGPLRVIDSAIRPVAWKFFPLWIDAPDDRHYRMLRSSIPLGPFFAVGILLVLVDAGPGLQRMIAF
ncbi:A24 family peptidase [Pirellulales bacterium]|nr:A24 family peptidase [Pirellulales bacterium]